MPDATLIEKSASRDRDAFATLVSRYQGLVCSLAYGICGDVGQSEDLAQEAFVAAWKKLDTLRERNKFKSWICGITRNLSLKAVRKRQTENSLKDTLVKEEQDFADTSEGIVNPEERQILWRAIEGMPENYREPLILFYREEQSVAKVADQLDLTEDAVKQRLSRGRGLLREKVINLMEDVLVRTKPGPVFTAAVVGALPGALVTSAAAATVGSASAAGKTAAGVGAAGTGMMAGALGGAGGAMIGYFVGKQTARFADQRKVLKMGLIGSLIIVTVFMLPWITLGLGWWDVNSISKPVYLVLWFAWFASFFAALGGWSFWFGKKSRDVAAANMEAGVPELELSPVRRWLRKWEGRRWNSRASFLGLPLISVAFSDPDRDFSGLPDGESYGRQVAKGWIAIGDRAVGLLAFGNLAMGGIAIGSVSLGIVSIGGVAFGGIALGGFSVAILAFAGLAVGVGAIGGLAAGVWSFGGASFGLKAASGGFAAARDIAVGGGAYAEHANDDVAKAYVESTAFFNWGRAYMEILQTPGLLPAIFVTMFGLMALMLLIGFRRKSGMKQS